MILAVVPLEVFDGSAVVFDGKACFVAGGVVRLSGQNADGVWVEVVLYLVRLDCC